MERQGRKYRPFARCVARRADGMLLEITLSLTIWKEYLFHVITVARPFPRDQVCPTTKGNIINFNLPFKKQLERSQESIPYENILIQCLRILFK